MIDTKLLNVESQLYVKGSLWICHTCKSYVKRNKMPKISTMNSLKIFDRPDSKIYS